jgi:hypothetical protein
MKNKGRKHKALGFGGGGMNCKGFLTHITRPVEKMSKGEAGAFSSQSPSKKSAKFDKKKWAKRVRGYWKSQTKDILGDNLE